MCLARELREKSEDDYYYNHEFVDKFRRDEASQQEAYEVPRELGYGGDVSHPTVPPRGVICAPNSSQTAEDEPRERHDTLDNEYVRMKPQLMQEQDAHSYINVPTRKAGRSVTMPQIQTPPPADDEDDDRPEYYNIHHHRSQPTEATSNHSIVCTCSHPLQCDGGRLFHSSEGDRESEVRRSTIYHQTY